MQLLIMSGLSGAGKSKAARILEDNGYYCVDNMPVALIKPFAQYCMATHGRYEKVVVVCDSRSGLAFEDLNSAMQDLTAMGCPYSLIFMEADDEVIIKRFKETRRMHPLTADGSPLSEAVRRERIMMEPIHNRAAHVINTSTFSTAKLRGELLRRVVGGKLEQAMTVNVMSFGFKYGLPLDADLVLDVRFLPNPYYIDQLRNRTGLEEPVRDFIFSKQMTLDYMAKLEDLLAFSLPLYNEEGKTNLVIAVGCTGGHHRSVAIAKAVGELVAKRGYVTVVTHRDISRENVQD